MSSAICPLESGLETGFRKPTAVVEGEAWSTFSRGAGMEADCPGFFSRYTLSDLRGSSFSCKLPSTAQLAIMLRVIVDSHYPYEGTRADRIPYKVLDPISSGADINFVQSLLAPVHCTAQQLRSKGTGLLPYVQY